MDSTFLSNAVQQILELSHRSPPTSYLNILSLIRPPAWRQSFDAAYSTLRLAQFLPNQVTIKLFT